MKSGISLTFLGGAGTVTGSKTLVEFSERKVLVDCGLFQGLKALRLLNRAPLPVNPATIEAVFITHAHLDHTGYLPLLVKNGFKGVIYATPPTIDLARIILMDSAKIQEEEAQLANKGGYSRHHPAEPLYTVKDSEMSLKYFVPVPVGEIRQLPDGGAFRFSMSGHILGSAFVELFVNETAIAFSGDLGRKDPLLFHPPAAIEEADYLVLESTYGNRDHPAQPTDIELSGIINDAIRKSGVLIIPTFAVERAQEVMYMINLLRSRKMIPKTVPVYLDSPMGIDATDVMMNHPAWHKLNSRTCEFICKDIIKVKEFSRTLEIIREKGPKIIIAGSGMLSGGRVLEYLKAFAGNKDTTILFVGYQAEGTRGRAILQGATEVKIHGRYYKVSANVREITAFSGHAGRTEILTWLKNFKKRPVKVFLNHGEKDSSHALKKEVESSTGCQCAIPSMNEQVILEPARFSGAGSLL